MIDSSRWPSVGDIILIQDVPTDAQKELSPKRQPPTRKGRVVETPTAEGHGHLVIDVGGEYGGITYSTLGFFQHYRWKPSLGSTQGN